MHTLIEIMTYCQNGAVGQQTIFKSYSLTVLCLFTLPRIVCKCWCCVKDLCSCILNYTSPSSKRIKKKNPTKLCQNFWRTENRMCNRKERGKSSFSHCFIVVEKLGLERGGLCTWIFIHIQSRTGFDHLVLTSWNEVLWSPTFVGSQHLLACALKAMVAQPDKRFLPYAILQLQ